MSLPSSWSAKHNYRSTLIQWHSSYTLGPHQRIWITQTSRWPTWYKSFKWKVIPIPGSLKSIINFKINQARYQTSWPCNFIGSKENSSHRIPFLCYSPGLYWGDLKETCTQIMLFHLSQKWSWACDLSEPCLPHGEDFSQRSVSQWVRVLFNARKRWAQFMFPCSLISSHFNFILLYNTFIHIYIFL